MLIPHPSLPFPDPSRSVFINCPYDSEYEHLFDAIIFTVISCGFLPRSAKESVKYSVPRMQRVFHALYTSNYSIHDLSRCHGEGEALLARFNMPLELGLAMSRRYPGNGKTSHDWFVLVPEGTPYPQFISDLAGYDLQRYNGGVKSLIQSLVSWLLLLPGAVPWQSPMPLIRNYDVFRKRKTDLEREWSDIPWQVLLNAAQLSTPSFSTGDSRIGGQGEGAGNKGRI